MFIRIIRNPLIYRTSTPKEISHVISFFGVVALQHIYSIPQVVYFSKFNKCANEDRDTKPVFICNNVMSIDFALRLLYRTPFKIIFFTK